MAEKKAGAKKPAARKGGAGAKKAAAKKRATSSPRPAKRGQPTHDQIARRAYELHEREGGHHEENWLRAERELQGE